MALRSFWKITEEVHAYGLLFPQIKLRIDFGKNWIGRPDQNKNRSWSLGPII
jgi:hypothetical protein